MGAFKMKNTQIILLISILILGVFLTGCSQTVVKYQCQDGSFKESAELCSEVSCQTNCPELDCNACPVKTETKTVEKTITKYQCYDGTIQTSLSNCKDPEKYLEEIKKTTFNIDDARTKTLEFVDDDYSIEELTKFTLTSNTLNIEFSHSYLVADIMKKSIFDFMKKEASYLKTKDKELDVQVTAISAMGGYLKCTTDWDDILKIANLEMGYEDWKSSASCSQNDLY